MLKLFGSPVVTLRKYRVAWIGTEVHMIIDTSLQISDASWGLSADTSRYSALNRQTSLRIRLQTHR